MSRYIFGRRILDKVDSSLETRQVEGSKEE